MELTKSIVIRVGEPVPLSDFSNSNDIRCSNTYFLNETDLVFTCFICDYNDFIKNEFSPNLHISSWNLVKEIDSNIYSKTELIGSKESSTYLEEKWEEIDDIVFDKLCYYLKDNQLNNSNWFIRNIISYVRNRKLKKLL